MTLISDVLGGGGGQTTYDVIIDAAGNGDYTSIRTACSTEAAGVSMFIRNGNYSEANSIVPKQNQKLVGESHGGVILTSSTTNTFLLAHNSIIKRTETQRAANNDAWDGATGLGTLSTTNNSNLVTYTGGTNPVAGDLLIIGKNEYYTIQSVAAGTITLDDVYGGSTGTGKDGFVSSSNPSDLNDWTVIKNITVINSNTGGKCFLLQNTYGIWMENITWDSVNTGINNQQGILAMQSSNIRIRGHNMTGRNYSPQGAIMYYLTSSIIDMRLTNQGCNGSKFNSMGRGSSTPMKHCYLHWSTIGGCQSLFWLSNGFVVNTEFVVDHFEGIGGWAQDGGGGVETYDRCRFKFGTWMGNGRVALVGKNLIVDLGNNESTSTLHEVTSKTASGYSIITAGNIEGTLNVDARTVIGSGVAYKVLAGAPAQNNGFDKP